MKRWLHRFGEARRRTLIEDALKCTHNREWNGSSMTQELLSTELNLSSKKTASLCQRMSAQDLIQTNDRILKLTAKGEQHAVQVIRAHRLWERFLVDEARLPLAQVHALADRHEHSLTIEEIHALDAALGYPMTDPHGDPIPTAEGKIQRHHSIPLTEWPLGEYGMIAHLEDEPVAIFAQIAALGLNPGQRIKVVAIENQRIVFTDDSTEFVLAPIVARNIHLVQSEPTSDDSSLRLHTLLMGQSAVVTGLDDSLQGYTRRRLLDLGLTVGASISHEYASFFGDPVAYRVRGSLIALRKEQSQYVMIHANKEVAEVVNE